MQCELKSFGIGIIVANNMEFIVTLDGVEVEQPAGLADLKINIARDKDWHGIFIEAATSDLTFFNDGADYLMGKKQVDGFAASCIIEVRADCDLETVLLTGKVDFRRYRELCGTDCGVVVSIEKEGCTMVLKNRYDQKVDLSSNVAFDKSTALVNYDGLNFTQELPGQEIEARIQGTVLPEGDSYTELLGDLGGTNAQFVNLRPIYGNEIRNSIKTGQLVPDSNIGLGFEIGTDVTPPSPISPILLYEDVKRCFQEEFQIELRIKGTFTAHSDRDDYMLNLVGVVAMMNLNNGSDGELNFAFGSCASDPVGDADELLLVEDIYCQGTDNLTDISVPFDFTYTGTRSFNEGDGLYAYLTLLVGEGDERPDNFTYTITFDPETSVNIFAPKLCPPTNAIVSMVNETGSRIAEAITNQCLRVKSDYYGRTDSQPYASTVDGCGGLRVLTSGLRIRNAENPVHFMSMKEFFEGLKAIDNIGMGVEQDTVLGGAHQWLRIEDVSYFYQDVEALRLPAVPEGEFALNPEDAYSRITIGYKKWETENFNGLDEFNSNKEYRTSLDTINNPIDATSAFIAGGYPIELTRQQNFIDSGGADTTYDNDTFILCMMRQAYGLAVEQGNISDAENFYSPATAYNWRIRPYYNLLRWWKSIGQSYINLANTPASRLFFTNGTGNLLAKGQLTAPDDCKLEAGARAENADVSLVDFAATNLPIYKAETLSIPDYPFSVADYNNFKANPYGYVSVQCGANSPFIKAYISNIIWQPMRGTAEINLKLKWQ